MLCIQPIHLYECIWVWLQISHTFLTSITCCDRSHREWRVDGTSSTSTDRWEWQGEEMGWKIWTSVILRFPFPLKQDAVYREQCTRGIKEQENGIDLHRMWGLLRDPVQKTWGNKAHLCWDLPTLEQKKTFNYFTVIMYSTQRTPWASSNLQITAPDTAITWN